jgi:Tol biopolymer transport system component
MNSVRLICAEILDVSEQIALDEATLQAQRVGGEIYGNIDFTLIGDTKNNIFSRADDNDSLVAGGCANTLWDGQGNDTYELDAQTVAGSIIQDIGGSTDTLNLFGSDILSFLPTVTVDYAIANSTATGGIDYNIASGQLTFSESETEKTITVEVIGDTEVESDETFFINLINACDANIVDNQGIGTIHNDDFPVVNFGASSYSSTEGSTDTVVNIPVTLSDTPLSDGTVLITINNSSTATAGALNDYTLSATSLIFQAGATGAALTQNVAVTINPDNIAENNETIVLNFGTITGTKVGTTTATTLTIEANDPIDYAISTGSVTVTEGNSGSTPITFTVSRSGGTDVTSSINYAIGGTATYDSDYNNIGGTFGATSTTNTINFGAGETTKTITMNVLGDTFVEPNKTITVSLSSPVTPSPTSTITTTAVTTTILNDDVAPTIRRVSVASDGTQGNSASWNPSISADGRYVAFYSDASNLVSGDTNGVSDTFVKDLQTGTTKHVSVTSDGTQGNSDSFDPSISADGRYVAFHSFASNLVSGDTNNRGDIFVKDLQIGTIKRISVASDDTQGNRDSLYPSISADGRYVAFYSEANNLVSGDTNGTGDIFVKDLQTDTTKRISVASDGTQGNKYSIYPSITADGRYVAFYSDASNLVSGDTNGAGDIFVKDLQTDTTKRISIASDDTQGNSNFKQKPSISADGRYVTFHSNANNLVSGDTNGVSDTFVKDLQTDTTERISVASDGTQGNRNSTVAMSPSISADGRYVAFRSQASNLVSGDTNNRGDIFVKDLQTGTIKRISVASDGTQGNSDSFDVSISADGGYVAFDSFASNLVSDDTNDSPDIFIYELSNDNFPVVNFDAASYSGTEGNSGTIINIPITLNTNPLADVTVLSGGNGNDTLIGGSDIDKFTFNAPTYGIDTISDFRSGQGDQIMVSANGFGDGLAVGNQPSSQFTIGSSAANASDCFIYNSSTGVLFFDPDGNGSQGQVQLAVL